MAVVIFDGYSTFRSGRSMTWICSVVFEVTMDFHSYIRLLRDQHIRRLLMVGLIARLPHSALGVVLTLHIAVTMGLGYGLAGLAAASLTLGIAVGAPWRGRQVDRVGLRRALIPSVIAEAVVWAIAPWLPYPALLVAVFIGGVFSLPIFSIVRQSLGVMTRGQDRQTAFALDSIFTEMVFMAGPAMGALTATLWSSAWGLVIIGVSGAAAGAYLMWFNPPTRSSQRYVPSRPGDFTEAEEQERAVADAVHSAPAHVDLTATELPATTGSIPIISALTSQADADKVTFATRVRRQFSWVSGSALAVLLVSFAAGLLMVAAEVSMVAQLESVGQASKVGIVFAFWCGASAVGGIFYGAMRRNISPMLMMAFFAVFTFPMAFAEDVWVMAIISLGSGFFTAPTLASASSMLSHLVSEERRGEAMGFYGSAMTAGAALGSPMAGIFIDVVSPHAGFVFASAVSLALVAIAWVFRMLRRRRRR